MTKPFYDCDGVTIYCGDCREIMPQLDAGSVSLVVADPPYCGVLDEGWDRQWKSEDEFLGWMEEVLVGVRRVVASNGSLYVFASPHMVTRLDVLMRQSFQVMSNLVWLKSSDPNGKVDLSVVRRFRSRNNERIVFAAPWGEEKGHDRARRDMHDEACRRRVFGAYIEAELARAGVTAGEVARLFPSRSGGVTGCARNWMRGIHAPTREQYETLQRFLCGGSGDYLVRTFDDLSEEYERQRRPFTLTMGDQWGEVWSFEAERQPQHPTQKPVPLIQQMVRVSSRPGDLVLDPFMGSGTTAVAAHALRRRFVGIEQEERYCTIAVQRLAQGVLL